MQESIEHKLGTSIAPTQHKGFIAENTLLMYMGKDLPNKFHLHTAFGQIGVITNQDHRQMTFLEVLPGCHFADKLGRNAVNHITPSYAVLCHEGVEDILLPAKHTTKG